MATAAAVEAARTGSTSTDPARRGAPPGWRRMSCGLTSRPECCKYFYDERGSALFEAITELPEYYQTRTETALLEEHAASIVEATAPSSWPSSGRARPQDPTLPRRHALARLARRLAPFEISQEYLRQAVDRLQADYPEATVRGIVGDFQHHWAAPGQAAAGSSFLAGTIGNLHPDDLPAFRRGRRRPRSRRRLLVGVDLVKDPERLPPPTTMRPASPPSSTSTSSAS